MGGLFPGQPGVGEQGPKGRGAECHGVGQALERWLPAWKGSHSHCMSPPQT